MANKKPSPRFEIAAAVVFRLGEELITDVVQALVELVKNSYDADATWANVKITTPIQGAEPNTPEALGEIVVEDNGHGMTAQDVERGWLMIADSVKKPMKEGGRTTSCGRTPVGDKGLGRLGVQRLGHDVEIVSRVKDPNVDELFLSFSWHDFISVKKLSDVPVKLATQSRSADRPGTRITVRSLKDIDQWTETDARSKLQRSLSELISPFKEVRDFTVTVTLDGEEVPIVEIAEKLRETASVRYELVYDGTSLNVTGKVKLDFVERVQAKEDKAILQKLLREDEGRSFFDYLLENETSNRPPQLSFCENSKWFVNFNYELPLADLGGARLSDEEIANPGKFRGEIDYILVDNIDLEDHVWDSQKDFRDYVREFSGIRVYRDGFGIRLGEDWLNLGRQQTSGGSVYGIRPKNVIGFIAISARDNAVLLETTSREGFQKTPHYLNFYSLLQKFVDWSSKAQEYLRRGALRYLSMRKTIDAGLEVGGEITSATDRLREHATSIDAREQSLAKIRNSMTELSKEAKSRVQEIVDDDDQFSLYHQEKLNKLNDLVVKLQASIDQIQETLDKHQPEATSIVRAQQILDVILEREERLRQELEMFYEGVALGLTAEALSHEISGVAERLSEKSSVLTGYLSKQADRNVKILSFVEHVKSSVSALRKQISHLDPALKYVREKRELVSLARELFGIQEFYKGRFSSHSIAMHVRETSDFQIRINRGKLSQVFDNLLLNSEYWLREAYRKDRSFSGEIYVEVNKPEIRIWDNGPGIARSVEDIIFDPFVTTKESGKGRGLGLFIVQQLLDAEGCSINLLPDRNEFGRRYKFEIDLRGALND